MTTLPVEERRFAVMSSEAHLVVVGGPPGAATWAEQRARRLEARWTRFADSELTHLNAAAGRPVRVSADTWRLVATSVLAWERTGGRFDPSVLPALVALGFDRSIEHVLAAAGGDGTDVGRPAPERRPPRGRPSPGLAGVITWTDPYRVLLPDGVGIDPGGIGKGLAADLVVAGLLDRGARGALVNLGGDAAVAGTPPEGDEWSIAVEGIDGTEVARVGLRSGGIATSGRHRRRWRHDGRDVHHLVDPSTGAPAASDVVGATVVAGAAWWAEALTKLLVVDGAGRAEGPAPMDAVVTLGDGSVVATGRLEGAVAGGARRTMPGARRSSSRALANL